MTESNTAPVVPFIPDLNREKVTKRTVGTPFFERDAYGVYKLALKHFRFEPGNKNNPYFRADCVILESNNETWSKGRDASIYFATGRSGTATDPGKPDRDDAYLANFVRTVFKVERGAQYDNTEALKRLLAMGKTKDESITLKFVRAPGNTVKMLDRKTGEVNEVTFPKDNFQIDR